MSRRRAAIRASTDEGEIASSVILLLVVVQVVLLVMHASLIFHGRQVANSAAQEALAAAQLFEGDAGAGQAAGRDVLNLSSGLFSSSNVSVSRGRDTVTATVTATIDTMLFPVGNSITVTVSGPAERYLPEADRR